MTRYVLDSNAVNAFVNRHEPFTSRVRAARIRGNRIGTREPVVAELYYGMHLSATRDENLIRLERGLSQIRHWPFDRRAAREYGRIAADLRRRGRPIQIIDLMVAAVGMTLQNCVVVTTDSDLSAVDGLPVTDWTTPLTNEP